MGIVSQEDSSSLAMENSSIIISAPLRYFYGIDAAVMFLMAMYTVWRLFGYAPQYRFLHFLSFLILMTTSICNFTLFNGVGMYMFYANHYPINMVRYIEWFITVPMQIIILGNIGGLTGGNIMGLCGFTVLMLVTGFIGDIMEGQKIVQGVYYAVSWLFYLPICIFLSEEVDETTIHTFFEQLPTRQYTRIGRYLMSSWFGYGVVFISDQIFRNTVITALAYSVLDIFSKFLFILWVLWGIETKYASIMGSRDSSTHKIPSEL